MKKICICITAFLCACSAGILMPKPEQLPAMQAKVPGITMARAQEGFAAYKENCSGCHRLHRASERTVAQWNHTLAEMFPKAKVKDEPTQTLIRDYLFALSK